MVSDPTQTQDQLHNHPHLGTDKTQILIMIKGKKGNTEVMMHVKEGIITGKNSTVQEMQIAKDNKISNREGLVVNS